MTENGVIELLRRKVRKAGGSLALARLWSMEDKSEPGISATYIRQVLLRQAAPGKLILGKLGLERVVSYRVRKGE